MQNSTLNGTYVKASTYDLLEFLSLFSYEFRIEVCYGGEMMFFRGDVLHLAYQANRVQTVKGIEEVKAEIDEYIATNFYS